MKNKEEILYQEQQSFQLSTYPSVIILISIALFYLTEGSPDDLPILTFVTLVIGICSLAFYKMTTTLTKDKLTISYGVGWIKKTYALKELKTAQTEEVNMPWYFGVGIRITGNGWLYNTRPGKALKIPKKKGRYSIFIGTQNKEDFLNSLKTIH